MTKHAVILGINFTYLDVFYLQLNFSVLQLQIESNVVVQRNLILNQCCNLKALALVLHMGLYVSNIIGYCFFSK